MTGPGRPRRLRPPSSAEEDFMYAKTMFAGWGDIDFTCHMRNTAFLDKSADVRMMFFAENELFKILTHMSILW